MAASMALRFVYSAQAVIVVASFEAPTCNPSRHTSSPEIDTDLTATSTRQGPVRFLPQDKGKESPACLDGSPYGFYFIPSMKGSAKWTLSIDGGGWCYDEVDCYCRSKLQLGTSKQLANQSSCLCMNPKEDGTLDSDCNCIRMHYCDGASFSGFRPDPWPVPEDHSTGVPAGATVTFRGIKNFDGVVDFALKNGIKDATEVVLTGGSAGGLSTFLHADRLASRLREQAPAIMKVRAAPVVGYFLDHDNFKRTSGGKPNSKEWSTPGVGVNYTEWMKYIYSMQNLTFGGDGGLLAACETKHPQEPWLCFMSPHMQDAVETPFFMFNSKYDEWQLANIFQSKWKTQQEQEGVLQYGRDFMAQLAPVYVGRETKHGGMITSCICHGCPWSSLKLEGKTSYEHYADWFYGKTSGSTSMHIDFSMPNANGTLGSPCFKFPSRMDDLYKEIVV
eukprot:TRINITY_DN4619_c2_g2_i1.p1 TRINITY_DN4619_c2_g2~~TRINITY_DN4619_c2_g2_i1.p1  ORF type:complete len:447 (+),score=56.31 TRINITY_DN4619_c2_g2_i1:47-1387(+)